MDSKEELIKNLSADGVSIVKFESKTCANCKFWDKILTQCIPVCKKQVSVVHVDVDEHKDYAQTMGIVNLPCIVLAVDRKKVLEYNGKPTKDAKNELTAKLMEL